MRILRSATAQYGLGYFGSVGCRMLRDLLLARMLGPATFGLWAALSVARQYSAYSDIGTTNGLGRLLPQALHGEDVGRAKALMGNAWLIAMLTTTVFGIGAFVWARPQETSGNGAVFWGAITIVLLMFGDKQQTYGTVVYASTQRVGESGLYLGLLGFAELVLCLALVPHFGLYGLYAGLLLAMALTIAIMWIRQPIRARPQFDRGVLRVLIPVSIVLMGYGLANIGLHNVDRLAIIFTQGTSPELGHYHLALLLSLVVSQAPYVVLSVLAPQMYRFSGDDAAALKRYMLAPTALMAVAGVAVAALIWYAVPTILGVFLPTVVIRRDLLAPLLCSELGYTISMVAANLLIAIDRGARGLAVRASTVILAGAASLVILRSGGEVTQVAWAMAITQCAGAALVCLLAARATATSIARLAVVVVLPILYGAAVMLATNALVGGDPSLPGTVLRTLVCAIGLLPLIVVPLGYFGRGPLAAERARAFLHWPAAA